MIYAPVIIPTLNRYQHFKQCIESLEQCTGAEHTDVFVGLDYPPSEQYVEGWKTIDCYLRQKEINNAFKKMVVFRREHNCGVKGSGSNLSLLHKFIKANYDRYILTEDDNVFSPNYLEYMNQCFEKYYYNSEVIAITGYSYPVEWMKSQGATVQKQNFNAAAWGWGWWTKKSNEVAAIMASGDMYDKSPLMLKHHKFRNNVFISFYEYMCASIIPIDVFQKNESGCLNLCDYSIRQYLTVYDKYIISPLVSKVRTIGYDGSGLYCQKITDFSKNDEWHTNFSEQVIDNDSSFTIVENDDKLLQTNLKLLDAYQKRPASRYIIAYTIAIGIRIFGLRFMRSFTRFVFRFWHRRIV